MAYLYSGERHAIQAFAISSKHFTLLISFWNAIIYKAEVSLDSSPESEVTTTFLLLSNYIISELVLLTFSAEVCLCPNEYHFQNANI